MRITVIGPAYPLRGGIAHHVYCLKQELTRRGHSVQVISFRKLYPDIFFPGKTELDVSSSTLDAGAEPVLNPLNPITWARAFKRVESFAPDGLIFQWWQPFFGLMIGTLVRLFHKKGLRCIIECHNVFPHESTPFDRLLLKFALPPADAFITHSREEEADLLPLVPGERISVASLPTPGEFFGGTNHARDGRTILFFGKVRKYKGLDVLLAAMPKVLSEVNCQLLIVGEFYDSIERYRQLIRKLELEPHVEIDNRYVPNEEVVGIFDRADVLVLPYLSATQSAVAQIALRNGLPVIASRTGGLSEVVIENVNGLLFPPGDSDALADQIISYFKNSLGPVFANLTAVAVTDGKTLAELIEDLVQGDDSAQKAIENAIDTTAGSRWSVQPPN